MVPNDPYLTARRLCAVWRVETETATGEQSPSLPLRLMTGPVKGGNNMHEMTLKRQVGQPVRHEIRAFMSPESLKHPQPPFFVGVSVFWRAREYQRRHLLLCTLSTR
jgi:hypothetical protein